MHFTKNVFSPQFCSSALGTEAHSASCVNCGGGLSPKSRVHQWDRTGRLGPPARSFKRAQSGVQNRYSQASPGPPGGTTVLTVSHQFGVHLNSGDTILSIPASMDSESSSLHNLLGGLRLPTGIDSAGALAPEIQRRQRGAKLKSVK